MEKHFITCLCFGLSNFKSILSLIRIFHRCFFDMSREMPERPPTGMVIMSDGSLLLGEDMTHTPMDPFTMMLANTMQQFLNKKKLEKEKKDAEKAKDKKPKGSNEMTLTLRILIWVEAPQLPVPKPKLKILWKWALKMKKRFRSIAAPRKRRTIGASTARRSREAKGEVLVLDEGWFWCLLLFNLWHQFEGWQS